MPRPDSRTRVSTERDPYWAVSPERLLATLASTPAGLAAAEAAERLARVGPNVLKPRRAATRLRMLGRQVSNPLLGLLVFAAVVSGVTGEWIDASIVLVIVVATIAIGYSREYSAQQAVAALNARIRLHVRALRDGQPADVDSEALVPGDVILLAAGNLVPADAVLLDATDCFVSESALTGESFPVQKSCAPVAESAPLSERTNCVFLGTNVRSGTARALVVRTGADTAYGAIAARLTADAPATEFDRGIRRFGYLLTVAMLVLVLVVFAAHMLRGRPVVDTLLFSIALAVGLSPELLPAILSVNLARGARLMARHGVLVRRLNAIENLGSMDVLCTDKTGTLTEGVIGVSGAFDPAGVRSDDVLDLAAINAALSTGLANPLDDAILEAHRPSLESIVKRGEIPFNFTRKRLTVVIERSAAVCLVTKGAFDHVLEVCTRLPGAGSLLDDAARASLHARYEDWSRQGIRVVAVAVREVPSQPAYSVDDETDMTFAGFVTFLDQPSEGVTDALAALARLGITFKLITGDSALVACHVAQLVGLGATRVLRGQEIDDLDGPALGHAVEETDVFAEADPRQKERIIRSLRGRGHVVGFLGDGVNDTPAMHAADTSLAVNRAVDVAREAADFVLLERGLDVIRRGVEEGRRTFANTLKYILITTSANLGNMISMAAASMVLPFLPLLPVQILLNNLLSDVPAVGLADDNVDPELVATPRRWRIGFIGRFMVTFGLISSVFDVLTFALLSLVFRAGPEPFRTAWFLESLLTELVIALVVRTSRPALRSRPGTLLLQTTVAMIAVAFAIPLLPFARTLGFTPLPLSLLATVLAITLAYVVATESLKRPFFRERDT